ncbi:hypothetical protein NBRC111894_4110 [Sporolactobacillus inulinus]|uniref:Uncharacterized protein n=1 Tax=Sporolactobacillus inulinus TaxID=2078 RepID=A0A4Y1ZH73_9BACL|nr:hypothetical protein NBRC111894_4110 [Sporolactobacillus inulinus]
MIGSPIVLTRSACPHSGRANCGTGHPPAYNCGFQICGFATARSGFFVLEKIKAGITDVIRIPAFLLAGKECI